VFGLSFSLLTFSFCVVFPLRPFCSGTLTIDSIAVSGTDASYFRLEYEPTTSIGQYDYLNIKVSFRSMIQRQIDSLDAYVEVKTSAAMKTIKIVSEEY